MGIYCGIPVRYLYTLQSGDPLPKFMTGGINPLNRVGFIQIDSKTRRDATELVWQVMITGIVD